MLTLNEAIAHARKVANTQKGKSGICLQNGLECEHFSDCLKCAEEHEQLAEWLEELKQLREQTTWIPCSERLPDNDKKEYIVQKTNGFIYILGFTKDAYKLSRYDFAEYKGKKKQLFYDYDSEYGYSELECEAWRPLPEPYKERD